MSYPEAVERVHSHPLVRRKAEHAVTSLWSAQRRAGGRLGTPCTTSGRCSRTARGNADDDRIRTSEHAQRSLYFFASRRTDGWLQTPSTASGRRIAWALCVVARTTAAQTIFCADSLAEPWCTPAASRRLRPAEVSDPVLVRPQPC